MIGWLLKLLLLFVLIRALMLVVGGLLRGMFGVERAAAPGASGAGRGAPSSGASMTGGTLVQDPVCGTYVVKERAIVGRSPDGPVYFCSERCRSAYDPQVARAR